MGGKTSRLVGVRVGEARGTSWKAAWNRRAGARILETCALPGGAEVGRIEAVWPPSQWEPVGTKSGLKNVKSVDFMFTEYTLCSRPCTGPFVSLVGYFYPCIGIPPVQGIFLSPPVPGTFLAVAMT